MFQRAGPPGGTEGGQRSEFQERCVSFLHLVSLWISLSEQISPLTPSKLPVKELTKGAKG